MTTVNCIAEAQQKIKELKAQAIELINDKSVPDSEYPYCGAIESFLDLIGNIIQTAKTLSDHTQMAEIALHALQDIKNVLISSDQSSVRLLELGLQLASYYSNAPLVLPYTYGRAPETSIQNIEFLTAIKKREEDDKTHSLKGHLSEEILDNFDSVMDHHPEEHVQQIIRALKERELYFELAQIALRFDFSKDIKNEIDILLKENANAKAAEGLMRAFEQASKIQRGALQSLQVIMNVRDSLLEYGALQPDAEQAIANRLNQHITVMLALKDSKGSDKSERLSAELPTLKTIFARIDDAGILGYNLSEKAEKLENTLTEFLHKKSALEQAASDIQSAANPSEETTLQNG